MFGIMMGCATLFVGTEKLCNEYADAMRKEYGQPVEVARVKKNEVFNII